MNSNWRFVLVSLIFLSCAALTPGCSCTSNPDVVTVEGTATQGRLTTICWLYMLHVELKRRSPADYNELRTFAEKLPAAHGGPSGLAEPFLISPRDNKPIVIRYGLSVRPETGRGSGGGKLANGPVIAYEQEGVKGRRFIVYAGSSLVEQVEEAQFKELVP